MNWDQITTILWLRWRLTRNQWARQGGLNAIISMFAAASTIMLGCLSFIIAFFVGVYGLREVRPSVFHGVWLGVTVVFLFLWLIGLINELKRSEMIDLQRLMHLPVALGPMFVINFLVSHIAFSIVLLVPVMMGLALGVAVSRGPAMLLLVPLALSMVFMITAWTYCLRGWLATLMSNPRRRRTVIVFITFGFVLLAQTPNLYFNVFHRFPRFAPGMTQEEMQRQFQSQAIANQAMVDRLLMAEQFVPPLWLPIGARSLAEGEVLPALLGMLGCFALGTLGLRRAYRGTVRFYYGETGGNAGARTGREDTTTNAAPLVKGRSRFLELRLPAVPEQATAVGLATFRSMLRAPEVKMAWATSFIVIMILGVSLLYRSAANIPEEVKPFIATGAAVMSVFMLLQFFANQFGYDRDGFRALILSPADRRLILLGKNLACLPAGLGFGVTLLTLIGVWLRLSPLVVLAALFQLTAMLMLAGCGGNVLSILVPYRIQAGSMKPTKLPGLKILFMVLCQMLFPIAAMPVLTPPLAALLWEKAGLPGGALVNLLLSAMMAALTGLVYWLTLGPLGRLLQRREIKILGVVTVEVE